MAINITNLVIISRSRVVTADAEQPTDGRDRIPGVTELTDRNERVE